MTRHAKASSVGSSSGIGARPSARARSGLLFALLFAAGLLLLPAPALGAEVHQFDFSFGSPGSGDGQLSLAANSGLAVNDSTGNIYVADTGNHRVDEFDSSGAFVRAFGADVGGAGVDVCTTGCVAGASGSAPGEFEAPTFIAVDNSGGPSAGDVYVADTSDNLVTKFEADGTLVPSWGAGGQLNGSTAPGGPFGEIAGIAVDSAGTLDVFRGREPEEPHLLFKFDQSGAFAEQVETPRANEPAGLAIDPAGNFFKANGNLSVEKFEGSGAVVGQVSNSFSTTGLAVDGSNGELFVDTGGSIENYAFEPSGAVVGSGCFPDNNGAESVGCPPTATFGAGDITSGAGLAVDGTSHTVYVADSGAGEIVAFAVITLPDVVTGAATEVGGASATLNGSVNPDEVPLTECFFEWGETESYGEIAPCEEPDAAEVGEGSAPVPVHAEIAGLDPSTTYHFRLVAANANGSSEGEDEEFTTLGPLISGETVSQVSATGAKIDGQVNPQGDDTDFFVEYVTEARFTESGYAEATVVPAPPQDVGSGTEFKAVAQQLSGLSPATTYHVRIVASNTIATVHGPDLIFSTFAAALPGLPDARAYEMVTPPQKAGEVFVPAPQVGLGGSCQECLPGVGAQSMPMQSRPDGEAVAYEGQPFFGGLAAGPNEYLSGRASNDWDLQSLSSPLFANGRGSGEGYEAFSPDLSRSIVFQVEPPLSPKAPILGGEGYADLYLRDTGGALQPLLTQSPPHRSPGLVDANRFMIFHQGANAGTASSVAFSHVLFEANDALTGATADAPAALDGGAVLDEHGLPANLNLYEWFEGQLRLVNVAPGNAATAPGAVLGSGRLLAPDPQRENATVDHAVSDDGSRIFWSEEAGGQVFVRIDGKETREVLDHNGEFIAASADGTRVLLNDGCLYGIEAEECEADLTGGHGHFEGILGASEDLSRVYFVDTAALTGPGEENANGEHAEAGKFNLYARQQGASTTFIGALLESDDSFGGGSNTALGTWKPSRSNRTAQVNPDGRYLAFMSKAPLTGNDNRQLGDSGNRCGGGEEGKPCFEVFEYDSASANLTCASCNPSGQRPLGQSNLSLIQGRPGFRQPGNLSAEGGGRLFFESQDVLTGRDSNGKIQDVYEWEPNGVGSCERAGGCVFLISSGKSANDSMFLDSSANGDDAFFVTRQQLLPRDKDDLLDLYDARAPHVPGEAVGFPEGEAAPCSGETCTGPPASPPAAPGLGSLTFSGPGNPPRRHKHKKHHKKGPRRHHKRSAKRNGGGSK